MIRALLAFGLLLFAGLAAPPAQAQPQPRTEQAVLAGGCFWCMEHDIKAIPGVISVESGYTGGHLRNPRYEDVTSETSGHYEAVRVTFDPARITYVRLLERYWRLVDPTDAGGQFCDRGPSYRAAIFAAPAQRETALASKARLGASGKLTAPIVTEVLPLGEFWPAEAYHREYAKRNPVRYSLYRSNCGRDARLKKVWRMANAS
jgi:peptide-methionine (S)-S-oxide reductase